MDLKKLLLQYNTAVPRYTSYPPANFFNTSFGNEQYVSALEESNRSGEQNISLYIHAPYCKQKCHFCGCNSIAWTSDSMLDTYLDAVMAEMAAVFKHIDTSRRKICQVHWGGGTPNNLRVEQIWRVMRQISCLASFTGDPEVAIECNPAYLDEIYIRELRGMGFTRMSLGLQDFNPRVLEAINRKPSLMSIEELVPLIKLLGFTGVNLDFVYGLPHQSVDTFARTIDQAIALGVERVVTFSYAHLPSLMAGQRLIDEKTLPGDMEKLDMFLIARQKLMDAGYVAVGFDHYALPSDTLAVALQQKQLKRNFQGYCTIQTTGQVYAFGASGISQLHGVYAQNHKTVDDYIQGVKDSGYAVARGYKLSRDELVCQHIIEELLCNGFVDLDSVAEVHGCTVADVFSISSFDREELSPYISDGLVEMTGNKLLISDAGILLARNIAQLFDPKRIVKDSAHSKTI